MKEGIIEVVSWASSIAMMLNYALMHYAMVLEVKTSEKRNRFELNLKKFTHDCVAFLAVKFCASLSIALVSYAQGLYIFTLAYVLTLLFSVFSFNKIELSIRAKRKIKNFIVVMAYGSFLVYPFLIAFKPDFTEDLFFKAVKMHGALLIPLYFGGLCTHAIKEDSFNYFFIFNASGMLLALGAWYIGPEAAYLFWLEIAASAVQIPCFFIERHRKRNKNK